MLKPTPLSQDLATLSSAIRVNGINPQQPVLNTNNLSPLEAARLAGNLKSEQVNQNIALNASRSIPTITGDSLLSLGKGIYGGFTGLTTAGLSALATSASAQGNARLAFSEGLVGEKLDPSFKGNPTQVGADTAAAVSGFLSKGSEAATALQSDTLNRRKDIINLDREQKNIVSTAKFEAQKADGTSLPSLRRFGRDFVNEIGTLKDNPSLVGDLVAEATGSLALSSSLAKVFGKGKIIGTPAAIATAESAGVYSQTLDSVNSLTEAELLEGSQEYVELRKTLTHEEARARVANKAAGLAAGIQFPVAAVLGSKLDKLTAAPFKKIPKSDILKTFGQEAIEEGLQSSTGEISSNIAIRKFADSQGELSEGVGTSGAQGVVGGIGVTGAVKTPAAIGKGAEVVAQGTSNAVSSVINGRKQSIANKLDAESGSGIEAVREAVEVIKADTTQEATELNSILTEEELNTVIPASLREEAEASTPENQPVTRIDTLNKIVSDIDAKTLTPEQEQQGALFVFEQVKALEQTILDNPDGSEVNATKEALNTIVSNPAYKQAVEKAYSQVQKIDPENPPEINNDFVNNTNRLAKANPAGVDPNAIDLILDQKKKGLVNFSPEIEKSLRASGALIRQINSAETQAQTIEQERATAIESQPTFKGKVPSRKDRSLVSQEIRVEGNKSIGGVLPSVNDFYTNTIGSIQNGGQTTDRNGEVVTPQGSFEHFGRFVQHQLNKLDAVNKSAALNRSSDNGISFDTLNPLDSENFILANDKGSSTVYVNPNSPNGIATAKQIVADTNFAISSYNALLDVYAGDLQGTKFEPVTLPPSLSGNNAVPAADSSVVSTVSAGTNVETNNEVNNETDLTGSNESSAPNLTRPIETIETLTNNGAIVDTNAPQGRRASDNVQSDLNNEITPEKSSETQNANESVQPQVGESSETVSDDNNSVETDNNQNASSSSSIEENVDQSLLQQTDGQDSSEIGVENEVIVRENLVKDVDGISRFNRALKHTPGKSKIADNQGGLEALPEIYQEAELDYNLDTDKLTAFNNFVNKNVPLIIENMNNRLSSIIYNTKSGETFFDAVKNGKNVTGQRTGKALTIVDAETGKYDQDLAEQAVLAALDWVLNSPKSRVIDIETAAETFGVSEDAVTEDMMTALRYGYGSVSAKESLATVIKDFWGVNTDNSVTSSDTRGIPEAVAAEILASMAGLVIDIDTFKVNKSVKGEVQEVDYIAISTNTDLVNNLTEKVGVLTNLLQDSIIQKEEKRNYFDAAPTFVAKTQKRNPLSKTTDTVKKAIQNLQNIPFKRNTAYLGMMNSLGKDAYIDLLGFVTDTDNLNVKDKESVEGKNLSILSGWDGVQKQDTDLKAYSEKVGKDPKDVNIHYNWYETKVNRLHMDGFGGQSNKTAREAYSPTVSTLDLNTKEHNDAFWLTVAQSSGLVKTEKVYNNKAISKVKKEIDKYGEAIAVFTDMINNDYAPLDEAQINTIKDTVGKTDEKLLHSLLAVARYYQAQGTDEFSSFEHMLSLEADGVTDGPINAMINFISGRFTERQFKLFSKGGFYLNSQGRTMNDHFEQGSKTDTADLYEIGAQLFTRNLKVLSNDLGKNHPKAAPFMRAMLNFSNHFSEISFDDAGNLEIGRNTLKNPLTVSVYGSGANGISEKVSSAMLSVFMEQLSNASLGTENSFEAYEGFEADAQLLFGSKTFLSKKTNKWVTTKPNTSLNIAGTSAKDFLFNKEQLENFKSNVRNLMVDPMVEAIDTMMGETKGTVQQFQAVTQIQSLVMIDKFDKRLVELTKEKRDSGEIGPREHLSQNDYNGIFKELEKFGAIIESEHQTSNVGTGEKSESRIEFSRTLDNKLSGQSTLTAPSNAGVRAAPYITIGRGDAGMVLKLYSESDALNRTLPVFDGIELAADQLSELSETINKAVADGWHENPAQEVSNSFNDFLRQNPFDGLSIETLLAIADIIKSESVTQEDSIENIDVNGLKREIKRLQDNLNDTTNSIQARKDTLAEFNSSTDHMASAEAPHNNVGTQNGGNNIEGELGDVVQAFNDAYEAKLTNRKTVPNNEAKFMDALKEYGQENGSVRTLTSNNFINMMNRYDGLSPELKSIYESIRSTIPDLKLVFGSIQDLTTYRDTNFPDRNTGELLPEGQIDLLNGIVYVTNQSAETAIHELVHATTIGKVLDYYTNKDKLSPQDQAAILRLEALMNEFITKDYSYESSETQQAAESALDTIYQQLALDTDVSKAAALNEFMAWTLTNQNLIELNKTSRVRNPLAVLSGKILQQMRKLIGSVKKDIYNNVLFNTKVLLSTERNLTDYSSPNIILNQVASAGSDTRIEALSKAFDAKINSWIKTGDKFIVDGVEIASYNDIDYAKAHQDATHTVNLFTSNGFPMTMQKATLFKQIQASLATQLDLDKLSLIRVQKLYKDTLEQLTVEDFLDDAESTDPYLRQLAQDRFKAVTGGFEFSTDKQGNTNLLSSFLALSQVDDNFRAILQNKEIVKSKDITSTSFDDLLTSTANSLINALAVSITNEGTNNVNTKQALDNLTVTLATVEADSSSFIEKATNTAVNTGNDAASGVISRVGRKIFKVASEKQKETTNRAARTVLSAIKLTSGLLDENIGNVSAAAILSFTNSDGFSVPVRELAAEVIGRTPENAEIIDQVNEVKYNVSALRQEFREVLPQFISEQFTRAPSKELKTKMFKLFGKTDASSLLNTFSIDKVLSLIANDVELNSEINTLEDFLGNSEYTRKALQLANFMNTGVVGNNLLTNAYAISKLLNESKEITDASPETIQAIDDLVSLYALRDIDPAVKRTINAHEESNGYKFILNYLNHLRQDENAKAVDEVSKLNGYKGYIPSETQDGVRMVIAENGNHTQMILDGYTKAGDYIGAKGLELGRRSYYYSNVNGNSTYSQGAMQTVQTAVNGVNPRTGKTLSGNTAGSIHGKEARRINNLLKGIPTAHTLALIKEHKDNGVPLPDSLKNIKPIEQAPEEAFIPRFDKDGKLSSLERSMSPDKLNRLNNNTDIGEMIGAWKGRQAEEVLAKRYNESLVDSLFDKFVEDSNAGRSDEYVDLSSEKTDKVFQDIWNVVPREMKDYIADKFGNNGFKVRRDLINPALGYRNASINDLFTSQNRLNEGVNSAARELFFLVTPNARKYLSVAEKGLQTTVSGAKQIIVTKSVIVPFYNILANTKQLAVRGVPPRFIASKSRQKLVEIDTHLRNLKRKIEIEAELIGLNNNTNQARKLKTELKSIDDAEARMSIAPLIKAGEFSTISEGLTELDEALTSGRWIDVIEGGIDRLPSGLRTIGKNALLTKDTAIFKGLSRAVQYGDFIGKAIYFEHLTKNKGLSEKEALGLVAVEFVNYNLPEGRIRSLSESYGITWFMNFKLRVIRIAVDMIQKNPLTALLGSLDVPFVDGLDVGSPIGDNFVTAGFEGRLPYSIGHDMLFESPQLNPWVNLIN